MGPRARAALAYVTLFTAVGAQAPYFVLYYRSLGFDLPAIGAIVSLSAAIGLLGAPLWGSISDALRGRPVVLLAATLLAAGGSISLAFAREPVAVVLSAAVYAVGFAGIVPILDARALETTGPDRAGYGPLRAWGSISYVAGAFGTGAAIERFGIGVLFVILVASLLLTGLVGVTLRPASAQRVVQPLRSAGRLFGPSALGLFLLGAWLSWTSLSTVSGFYALRLDELGAAAAVVGAAAGLGAAVEVPIMLRFPALAARLGADRLLVAGAAIFAVRAVLAAVIEDPVVLVILSGVNGIGFAFFVVGGVTYVSQHAPPALAATAQGIFQGVTVGLAQVTAGSVGGVLAGVGGLVRLYLVAAVVGAIGVAIVAAAVRRGAPGVQQPVDRPAAP